MLKPRRSFAGAAVLAVLALAGAVVTDIPASAQPTSVNDTFTLSANTDSTPDGAGTTTVATMDENHNGLADEAAITASNLRAIGVPSGTSPGNYPPMRVTNNRTHASTSIASTTAPGGSHPGYTIGRFTDEL